MLVEGTHTHTHIMLRNLPTMLYMYAQTVQPLCFVLLDIVPMPSSIGEKMMNFMGHSNQSLPLPMDSVA